MVPYDSRIKLKVLAHLEKELNDALLKFKGRANDETCQHEIKKSLAARLQEVAAQFAFDATIKKEILETEARVDFVKGSYVLQITKSAFLG